jgi:hypothetical protein
MSKKNIFAASALSACAAAAAIALGPIASADGPADCAGADNTAPNPTVCQDPGNASIGAPGAGGGDAAGGNNGANAQNGPYGPSGDVPPVGGNNH